MKLRADVPSVPSEIRAVRFRGTERFQLIRLLGRGGMGVVYEAEDRELGIRVALKMLPSLQPSMLRRFKKEFRAAAGIRHLNVVRFGELFSDGERWFFTMELVEGVGLIARLSGLEFTPVTVPLHVGDTAGMESVLPAPTPSPSQPSPPPQALDMARLRDAFTQLAQGLTAIHNAGQVHRDLKPSNVLATRDHRVVILDFGLATECEVRTTFLGAGTPAYMAPEQGGPTPVGPAADWYAFGAMLFEALTGTLPFVGQSHEILYRKQREDPPSVRQLAPNAPEDLARLCEGLLSRSPQQRPDAHAILEVLGAPQPSVRGINQGRLDATPLFGRSVPMAALRSAFDEVVAGARLAVLVSGEPGIGKTEVCRHFLATLAAEQGVQVLRSRCHEREFLPFKALDGVIDHLARHFAHGSPDEQASMRAGVPPLLRHLFPALEQFPEIDLPDHVEIPSDPRELRSGMVDGLRELLAIASGKVPLVVFIDDLQWADADSLAVFSALLADPRTPRMMLLATHRGGSAQAASWLDPEVRPILVDLPRLDRESTHALLQSVFGVGHQPRVDLEPLAETTQGNALFIKELASYVLAHDVKIERLQLDDLLRDRVARAGATGRVVLDLVAAVGAPVPEGVVQRASALDPWVFSHTVTELLQARLVQASGSLGRERIELCHEQLRLWLWNEMDVARRRALSAELASAFGGEGDPAQVAGLWLEAGHDDKAATHLVEGGEHAMKGLAFDRAAEHFAMAIKVGSWDAKRKGALSARLGDALAYAGKGAEAAAQYLAAAGHEASTALSLDLYRKATAELLRSGHFDEGLRVAIEALRAAGMEIPTHSIPKLLWVRARLRLRRLRCPATPAKPVSPEAAARIDLCWALSSGLCLVDPIKGAYFQALSLLLALQEQDLPRVGRGLAGEAAWCVGRGQAGAARARRMLALAKDIEKRLDDPHARGLNLLMSGLIGHLAGEFRDSRQHLEEAQIIFTKQCVGAVWEMDAVRQFLMEDLFYLGDLVAFRRLITAGLRQATERGSRYAVTNFRTGLANFVWLLRDDPGRAHRETAEGIQGWSEQGFHVQHWNTLLANTQTELYLGQGRSAYELIGREWRDMARSGVFHIQHTRIAAMHLRARAALAGAQQSTGKERAGYLKEARRCLAKLGRQPDGWAQALTRIAGVSMQNLEGRADLNGIIAAIRALQENDLLLFAHAARVAAGKRLACGPAEMDPEASRSWMGEMGIVNPEAIVRTLVPGLDQT